MSRSRPSARPMVQLPLPLSSPATSTDHVFSDPSFAINRQAPIHRWVPWIAGFSGEFVADILRKYLTKPGVVLDPFAGVGTTLVEAVLHGHEAVGFEINPYATFCSRVKSAPHKLDVDGLRFLQRRFHVEYAEALRSGRQPQSVAPSGFKTRVPFYSEAVLRKVLHVQDFIHAITDSDARDVFRLAFASTMVRYSNYSYEPSLGTRAGSGKENIHDYDVGAAIFGKLSEIIEDIAWAQTKVTNTNFGQAKVVTDTFFNYARSIPEASIDLAITSPPYLNNYHYNRNTRPQLYWLGFTDGPADLKPLEMANFGKFWQTVREGEDVRLTFTLPGSDLEERIAVLRTLNKDKGTYGGNGWANYAASYFNDCYRLVLSLRDVLKKGGTALVVIGNSILQGIHFPTDRYLGEIAELVGLELVQIAVPRATRVGSSIIQSGVRVASAPDNHQLYESVVEIRRG